MAEPKDWKSWLPNPNVWKSWMPEPKAWKSWTPEAKGRRSGMSPNQGVVKQDWVATGRIDFATRDTADADQPSEFKLLAVLHRAPLKDAVFHTRNDLGIARNRDGARIANQFMPSPKRGCFSASP